jgi:hypothetical protein
MRTAAIDAICAGVSELRGRVHLERARANLGTYPVDKAFAQAGTEMRTVMGLLTWWRAAWRVDQIGEIVNDAVDKAWCNDLEKHVRPHPLLSFSSI